ncbi:ricin-type beta-trefoil lectin domain protein [Kitasatospora sp. NPDC052896]|uniref:ricin-type beta-trefoil lectin domain protein n=1 Tax=Kitasatospora sp. NPDC052896 TaxID=3364061 RepID=UPI0037C5307E
MRERSVAPRRRLPGLAGRLAAVAALTTLAAGLAAPAQAAAPHAAAAPGAAVPGDLTGDGSPDITAAVDYPGDLNVFPAGGAPFNASSASQSPEGGKWNAYLVTHHGSLTGSHTDDLYALSTGSHKLYAYPNDANYGGTPGHFTHPEHATVITKPACAAGTDCTSYDPTWASTTQIVAVDGTANSAGLPDLITVEGGKLWYYPGKAGSLLGSPVLLGTSGWSDTTVVAPGEIGGTPTLWVRDNPTGALLSLPLTLGADGIPNGPLVAPASTWIQSAATQSNGDHLCLDTDNDGTSTADECTPVPGLDHADSLDWLLGRDGTVHSEGWCLDPGKGAGVNGGAVAVLPCDGRGSEHHWQVGPNSSLVDTVSGRCVTVGGDGTDGSPVVLASCAGTPAQSWGTPARTGVGPLPAPLALSTTTFRQYRGAGQTLTTAGDLDGDGITDLVMVGWNVVVYPGRAAVDGVAEFSRDGFTLGSTQLNDGAYFSSITTGTSSWAGIPAAGALYSSCARLAMEPDGNLVLQSFKDNHSLWSSGTDYVNGDALLTKAGALEVGPWTTPVSAGPGASLTVQDDCNVVLRNASGTPVWSTGTYDPAFDHTGHVVTAGSTLAGGSTITLPQTRLDMQADGNLVLYSLRSGLPLWSSRTYNHPGAYADMQSDGNLVVYAANGAPLWSTGTYNNPGSHLVVQNDSNVVLYNADDKPAWNSGTYYANPALLGTAITSGSTVQSGAAVAWSHGTLSMQADGNLVLYTTNNRAVWNTGTYGHPGAYLTMQTDGNLVLHSATGSALWYSGTYGNPGAQAVMQNDGNLVIYTADGKAIWSTNTYGV